MNNIVNQVAFIRTTRSFPEEIHQLSVEMNKTYIDIANAVNNRTISIFPANRSAITGESWFIKNQRQQSFRQIYPFGAISAGSELDIPIDISNFTMFTRIYGTVITTTPDYRPLPYTDPTTSTTGMALLVGPIMGILNIRIVLGATAQPVTSGNVVLEWLSQV